MSETALVPVVPGLESVRKLLLDAVRSPLTRAMYGKALDDFFVWWEGQGRPPFVRATVQAHVAWLEAREYSPSTINQRLAAIRKLAREAALNGLLAPEAAAGIDQVPGAKQRGTRAGNWLTREQAQALLDLPDPETPKGKRDRAVLSLLIRCALRRSEAAGLELADIQQREVPPSRVAHVDCLDGLAEIHRDPFGRMLVAQALAEEYTLISRDGVLARYGAPVVWG